MGAWPGPMRTSRTSKPRADTGWVMRFWTVIAALAPAGSLLFADPCQAQTAANIPLQIATPDRVETPVGTLEFRDGIPSADRAAKLYDQLDLSRGVESFLTGFSRCRCTPSARGSAMPAS